MQRSTTLAWSVAVLGAILVVGFLLMPTGKPKSWSVPARLAKALYTDCMAVAGSVSYDPTHHPDHADHPGLHLGSAPGVHDYEFGDVFDDGRFIGMIKKEANLPPSPRDDIGDDWKTIPADSVCVFMGGQKEGIYAYIVWKKANGDTVGVQREVVARFHRDRHGHEGARWRKDIEENKIMNQDHLLPEVTGELMPEDLNTGVFGVRVDGGPGTWYTCATNTCCKIL